MEAPVKKNNFFEGRTMQAGREVRQLLTFGRVFGLSILDMPVFRISSSRFPVQSSGLNQRKLRGVGGEVTALTSCR